jgi:hypothetical protein
MPENIIPKPHAAAGPWGSRHDMSVTQETIKKLLAGGTPNWVRFPKDYKAFAQESLLADREISERMTRRYKMEDQESLLNTVARKVNLISTRDLVQKLRDAGVKCYTIDNAMPQTVGLWAFKPGTDVVVAIAFFQVPAMCEWSILRLDKRGLPSGEAYRGWRTVESELIKKGIISEVKADEIFGRPVDGPVSKRFRRDMYWFRNRRELNANYEEE